MRNKNIILLTALLKSSSLWNISKYSKDKKKRRRVIAGIIGFVFLFLMMLAYCLLACLGFDALGIIDTVPVTCALLISTIAFFFTLFKTNGYLFHFKEYDMLMALPLRSKDVAGCKFLYMYIKSLPWYAGISLSMMMGYGIFAHPHIAVYPVWIILSLFVPIIPMLFASFLGFLIAKISSGFRKKNIIQIVLSFAVVMFSFSLRYIVEALIRSDRVADLAAKASDVSETIGTYYLPAGLFANAILSLNSQALFAVFSGILLIGLTLFLFEAVFALVGRFYRQINSALSSHEKRKNFQMRVHKRGVLNTIAFKEFRRMTGSTTYFVNVALGEIMAAIAGVAVLMLGFDRVVSIVTQGAPIPTGILNPAIPLILYFLIGMMTSTAVSPSLEGKNYWIMQSLPLTKKTLYRGKILFQMYLSVPFMIFGILCFGLFAHVALLDMLLYLAQGVALCAFSATWGCVCGVKYMRLDWENEIEVIKQGTAVPLYLLPNMFVTMGMVALVVWLGTRMNTRLITLALIAVVGALAMLSYRKVMRYASL
ncbi:MAG: hypothetical protein K6G30_07760 [Acetatifactor sp.]|nr:hypothetical protein [Acetatifactor sp.]